MYIYMVFITEGFLEVAIEKCIYIYIYIYIYIHIYIYTYTYIFIRQSNVPSFSSPQWLCGDMPAMDSQWKSSRIFSVRINRMLNKHYARNVNILIKTEIGSWHTEWGGWAHWIIFMTHDFIIYALRPMPHLLVNMVNIYYIYIFIYIYIYIYLCVLCVCVCVCINKIYIYI